MGISDASGGAAHVGHAGCDPHAGAALGEHNEALLKPLLGEAEYEKLCATGTISKGKKKGS